MRLAERECREVVVPDEIPEEKPSIALKSGLSRRQSHDESLVLSKRGPLSIVAPSSRAVTGLWCLLTEEVRTFYFFTPLFLLS
jgi:hypothetical protein